MTTNVSDDSNDYKPLLPGTLQGKGATFFLDTGSDISIISKSTLIQYGFNSQMHPSPLRIVGVSGCVGVMGWVEGEIHWKDHTFIQKLLVLDTNAAPGNILLGYDFLRQAGIVLFPDRHAVRFGYEFYKLTARPSEYDISRGPSISACQDTQYRRYIGSPNHSFYSSTRPYPHYYRRTYHQSSQSFSQHPRNVMKKGHLIETRSDPKGHSNKTKTDMNIPSDRAQDLPKAFHVNHKNSKSIDQIKLDREGDIIFTANVHPSKEMEIPAFSRILMDVKVNVKRGNEKITSGKFIVNPLYVNIDGLSVIPGLYSFNESRSNFLS